MLSLPRILTALLVAGAGTGALAAAASADSIVYVKDGNVWLTSPDAAKQYQVTLTVRRASGKAVKGALKTAGKAGANTLRFKGRIGGKTVRPGRYRLTITARATVGGGTAQATMAFRIVR
jgi:hypothetical protein